MSRDSANTATSLATGVITNIGRVGTGPEDQDLETILEMARLGGVPNRSCQHLLGH